MEKGDEKLKKAMTRKGKKSIGKVLSKDRSSKYEEKLKVDASFDEILRATIKKGGMDILSEDSDIEKGTT